MSPAPLILLVITSLLAALTVLPLSRNPAWWVRTAEFPRLQLSVLLLVTLLLTLLAPITPVVWGLLAVQLVCLAYQAWWILPYSPLFPLEVRPAGTMIPSDTSGSSPRTC